MILLHLAWSSANNSSILIIVNLVALFLLMFLVFQVPPFLPPSSALHLLSLSFLPCLNQCYFLWLTLPCILQTISLSYLLTGNPVLPPHSTIYLSILWSHLRISSTLPVITHVSALHSIAKDLLKMWINNCSCMFQIHWAYSMITVFIVCLV